MKKVVKRINVIRFFINEFDEQEKKFIGVGAGVAALLLASRYCAKLS